LVQNGRSCLGDVIYRYVTSDKFSAESLLDCLDLSSEHIALDIANRVEASIYVWRRRVQTKLGVNNNTSSTTPKLTWEMVKELMAAGDKRGLLVERSETLLRCLKQRFPSLTQTSLDISKIQWNKVQTHKSSKYITVQNGFACSYIFSPLKISGYWEINPRKLLKGFGELSIKHHSTNR